MVPNLDELRAIRTAVLEFFRGLPSGALHKILHLRNYHGFGVSRLSEPLLASLLYDFGFEPKDVQVEVVRVDCDLTHEIHIHREATAVIAVLGPAEHLDSPRSGLAYYGNRWVELSAVDELEFPPECPHTVTITEPNGLIYFLSVQAPPIRRPDSDDYFRVRLEKEEFLD